MNVKRTYNGPIYENKFIKILLQKTTEIYRKHPQGDQISIEEHFENIHILLNHQEKYVLDVSEFAFNITNIYEQLIQIPIFIKYYPTQKNYPNNGITKDAYIKYHLENHFIRVSTIIDQLVLLINAVYYLGLTPQRCSVEAILDNYNTKGTKVASLLKEFNKSAQGVKSIRNKIVHRGMFYDQDIRDLATFIFLNEQYEKEFISSDLILKLHEKVIKDKVDLMSKNNEAVLKYVIAIFDSLEKHFVDTFKRLESK